MQNEDKSKMNSQKKGRKKELSPKAIENLKQEQQKLKEKAAKAEWMKLREADRKHEQDCAKKKRKKR